jgi:hypothetical protein
MKLLDLSETDYVFTRGGCAGERKVLGDTMLSWYI